MTAQKRAQHAVGSPESIPGRQRLAAICVVGLTITMLCSHATLATAPAPETTDTVPKESTTTDTVPKESTTTDKKAEPTGPAIVIINSNRRLTRYAKPERVFIETLRRMKPNLELIQSDVAGARKHSELIKNGGIAYCIGTAALAAASRMWRQHKIVFSSSVNWHRIELGKQTYGVSNRLPLAMELTTFKYVFPLLNRVGFLYTEAYTEGLYKHMRKEAEYTGVKIVGFEISRNDDVIDELESILPRIQFLWLLHDPIILKNMNQTREILEMAMDTGTPILTASPSLVRLPDDIGATFALAPEARTVGQQAALLALDLAEGREPRTTEIMGTSRMQYPAGSYTLLHLPRVKKLELPFNQNALPSINEVIEE